jgi:molybdopterin synthase sulfur carrier subunit
MENRRYTMIKVLLFSYLRDVIGFDSLEIDKEEMSVEQIKQYIIEKYGVEQLKTVMVAINEEFVMNNDYAKAGDIVALIPPVSGG